ncbi:MAG: hypothetical protein JNJ54_12240 [Myxococcaceae bacterium]|nr:hypothetical protein [Myxococcaceae bacterium]
MGIDSLKSGLSSLVTKVEQKVEQTVAQVKTAVAPQPPAPKEEFVETKKKPVSITGKFKPVDHGAAKADLSSSVSSLRTLANSGLAANAIGATADKQPVSDSDRKKLATAIKEKDASGIREIVNKNPAALNDLSSSQKGKALEALRSGYTTDADKQAMVAIVRSCRTKGELRDVLQAASGGTSQSDMHKFDKELTSEHPYLIADLLNPDNKSLPETEPGRATGSMADAIAAKSDTKIREAILKDPSVLKGLSPREKGQALEILRSGWTSGDDQKAMIAIVRSCETKGELRNVLQAASGGISPDDMKKYDKQMTSEHPCLIADLLNKDNTSLPEVHRASVSANDHVGDETRFPAPDGKTVDVNDPASRKAFLEGLTQVDSKRKGFTIETSRTDSDFKYRVEDDPRQYGCGPTCIIASAMQGKDPKGSLLKLCDYNLKTIPEGQRKQLEEVRDKLQTGKPLTRGDFDVLQRTTYEAARVAERKFADARTDNGPIDARAIKLIMEESGVGFSGGTPRLIDSDRVPTSGGARTGEHFVLEKDGAIYDPWPRQDGKQTVPAGSPAAKRYQESYVET